jgi:outer membrane biosynthesis protein TonB
LQPTPPPAPPPAEKPQEAQEPQEARQAREETKPKATYTPGDLAMAKPDPKPQKENAQGDVTEPQPAQPARPPRPRTVAEAKARMQDNRLVGEKMKQDGGVRNRRMETSLDVQGSLFGAYDLAVVLAVQHRWYDLLDSRGWAADRTGRVTIRFHLNADGTVTEMKFMENTVDLALGMLCQSAIKDPSPFALWPSDMRRAIGANFREVTFTFFYY